MPITRSHHGEPYHKRSRTSYQYSSDSEYSTKWSKLRKFDTIKTPKPIKASEPNSILRVTIWDPAYEVTTETLYYLFSQYGMVIRIVLFMKNGLPNGMIEMDSVEGEVFG